MQKPSETLVAVAMSGGVDSSVAALLLHRAGYRVVGLTMKLWSPPVDPCDEGSEKSCCTVDSAMDAKRVCDQIGVPHFTLDMQEDFEERVITPFYEAYRKGETPNPCVNCNSFVKWDALWARARAVGADFIATGHYAQTTAVDGKTFILRGDAAKDQSYFLWGVPPETLAKTLFPLAQLSKTDVRRLATEAGLRTAQKAESQDICFVTKNSKGGSKSAEGTEATGSAKGDYRTFIDERAEKLGHTFTPGPFIGPEGKVLGTHTGIAHYTIGQRKGLGVAYGEPLYVRKVDAASNAVHLGRADDLRIAAFRANHLNRFEEPWTSRECLVQFRYRSRFIPGLVRDMGNGEVTVELQEPGFGISPGQSAAFYDGDRLIGGARITATEF